MDEKKCPRCGQEVKIGPMYAQIKPHRDYLVKAACPTEGMTMREAEDWVARAREEVRSMR